MSFIVSQYIHGGHGLSKFELYVDLPGSIRCLSLDFFGVLVDVTSTDRFVISSESCDFLRAAPVSSLWKDKIIYAEVFCCFFSL